MHDTPAPPEASRIFRPSDRKTHLPSIRTTSFCSGLDMKSSKYELGAQIVGNVLCTGKCKWFLAASNAPGAILIGLYEG